ncbi:MAG: hypoxanthine phosphoribosyltransferase [bacterium]|nr:hypoxanthine phosphoribosyltransferase [bacterium]
MNSDIEKILLSQDQIATRVKGLGAQISQDYAGKNPLLISVLKGSIIFLSDLLRQITIPCSFDLMTVSSYGKKTKSSSSVKLVMDLKQDVANQHVIIIEDVFDSGRTIYYILEHIKLRNPASVKTCVLLNKLCPHEMNIQLDYIGFDIPNEFVVGYGLDYGELYRNLPYVCVLKPEVYQKQS